MTQQHKTILYIEDDRGQQRMYKSVFEKADYRVLIADDKTSGFALAKEHNPDVILLDLLLSGEINARGGIELLEQLKKDKQTQEIPVIIFTNYTGEDVLKKVQDLGAAEVVVKVDVTPRELLELIEKNYMRTLPR